MLLVVVAHSLLNLFEVGYLVARDVFNLLEELLLFALFVLILLATIVGSDGVSLGKVFSGSVIGGIISHSRLLGNEVELKARIFPLQEGNNLVRVIPRSFGVKAQCSIVIIIL